MLNRAPKQKVCFVQQHKVSALALLVIAAAFAVIAELPLAITCFAAPILFELVGDVAMGLGKCPFVAAGHPQELDQTH